MADLLLAVGLLAGVFEIPATFSLRYMVPGTALGVLVGDLFFFYLAFKLAHKTGRTDVTAMPLGLDTPSTFGMVFFVLGPAFVHAKKELGYDVSAAATYMWHIGMCSIFSSGIVKLFCAAGSNWIRRVLPRAGLLGSLAAIALVLISFLPLVEIMYYPVVGMLALAVILTTLVAKVRMPFRLPGALGALLVAGAMYYLMSAAGLLWNIPVEHGLEEPQAGLLPGEWLSAFRFEWLAHFSDSIRYLPIVIPFALATVVGGIDCTESAAAVGDHYDTRQIIAVEAIATLAAAVCGGVIQTTPYIGHPAYKSMGGRAAYALATAVFIALVGVLGIAGYFYLYIPKPAVFPILVFVGLEISAQSFYATPKKHYAAVAIACVPALASLGWIYLSKFVSPQAMQQLPPPFQFEAFTVQVLAAGFIVTSLLWASALAAMIDRRLDRAAAYYAVAALGTLTGIMHSPFPGSPMFWPWHIPSLAKEFTATNQLIGPFAGQVPWRFAGGYAAAAVLLFVWQIWLERQPAEDQAEHAPPGEHAS